MPSAFALPAGVSWPPCKECPTGTGACRVASVPAIQPPTEISVMPVLFLTNNTRFSGSPENPEPCQHPLLHTSTHTSLLLRCMSTCTMPVFYNLSIARVLETCLCLITLSCAPDRTPIVRHQMHKGKTCKLLFFFSGAIDFTRHYCS
ncbi:unnamed protein product [Chondrus crispus]|uniref:Uncharacterized protein n=1 Tax=Chondrus crispus TaxID=2769 RepID=R7QD48_CHOCR|nr:unnamed protein product [Chondrus crispus]CDF36432.1 unnamed protein product [Chondrus crispus]|eukprot:XP_005716251.1 unnamed protein product [Chondrus crispus]